MATARTAAGFWSKAEETVLDRFARAVVAGRYAGSAAAVTACRQAITLRTGTHRTWAAVRCHLRDRAHALGWKPPPRAWGRSEQRVVERFARAVVAGRYPDTSTSLADCRAALERAGARGVRSDEALVARILERTRRLGRVARRRWTPDGIRVLDRFAGDIVAGRFRSAHAATGACIEALGRTRLAKGRSLEQVRSKLSQRINIVKGKSRDGWTNEEVRIVDGFVRATALGQYRDVPSAAPDCLRKLSALPAAGRAGTRNLDEVTERLWEQTAHHGPRRAQRLVPGERPVIERFARAVADHHYPSIERATRDCWRALIRRRDPNDPLRSLGSVRCWLVLRARDIGGRQLAGRAWTETEVRITRKWAAAFARYRAGRARANLNTASAMMRTELGRLGYYRTEDACRTRIYEVYRRKAGSGTRKRGGPKPG